MFTRHSLRWRCTENTSLTESQMAVLLHSATTSWFIAHVACMLWGCCWTNKCVSQCHDVNCDYDLCDNGILWYICSFNVLVFVCCVSLSSLCVSKSVYQCHVCLCVICTFYDNAATWQGCSHTAAILRLHWWWCSMIGLIVILFSQHGSVILWKTEYMRQDLKYQLALTKTELF